MAPTADAGPDVADRPVRDRRHTSQWALATPELHARLTALIPKQTLVRLHRRRPALHLLVLGWQLALLGVGGAVAWLAPTWWLASAGTVAVGFTFFNFTVMLHEVVHGNAFPGGRKRRNAALGHFYAFWSGISATQFTRWHLDHHAHLGTEDLDPKRAWLSPKRNRRWFKALYLTPALIPIYFRAARRAAADYPESTVRAIRRERRITIAGHALLFAALAWAGGAGVAFRTHLAPMLFVFPVAFTLNRLGQHYDIAPGNPALWGTVMRPSRFWDVAFLWSRHHIEHHYFPRVPFYNLPALHRALRPFFNEIGARPSGYIRLLWLWLVRNRAPHTDWRAPA